MMNDDVTCTEEPHSGAMADASPVQMTQKVALETPTNICDMTDKHGFIYGSTKVKKVGETMLDASYQ